MKTIFWGLDHTLIDAGALTGKPDNSRSVVKVTEREAYAVVRREALMGLLVSMQGRTDNRLLTYGPRNYAYRMNQACGLGFTERDILAREDFSIALHSYSGLYCVANGLDRFPRSLLIDDFPKDLQQANDAKKLFLGDPLTFKIRSFKGQDPEVFAKEEIEALEDWIFTNF